MLDGFDNQENFSSTRPDLFIYAVKIVAASLPPVSTGLKQKSAETVLLNRLREVYSPAENFL